MLFASPRPAPALPGPGMMLHKYARSRARGSLHVSACIICWNNSKGFLHGLIMSTPSNSRLWERRQSRSYRTCGLIVGECDLGKPACPSDTSRAAKASCLLEGGGCLQPEDSQKGCVFWQREGHPDGALPHASATLTSPLGFGRPPSVRDGEAAEKRLFWGDPACTQGERPPALAFPHCGMSRVGAGTLRLFPRHLQIMDLRTECNCTDTL